MQSLWQLLLSNMQVHGNQHHNNKSVAIIKWTQAELRTRKKITERWRLEVTNSGGTNNVAEATVFTSGLAFDRACRSTNTSQRQVPLLKHWLQWHCLFYHCLSLQAEPWSSWEKWNRVDWEVSTTAIEALKSDMRGLPFYQLISANTSLSSCKYHQCQVIVLYCLGWPCLTPVGDIRADTQGSYHFAKQSSSLKFRN